MAMPPTIDLILPQLFLDIEKSSFPVPSLDVQALLTVPLWPAAHAIGIPVFLPCTVIYLVREINKDLLQTSYLARGLSTLTQLYQ